MDSTDRKAADAALIHEFFRTQVLRRRDRLVPRAGGDYFAPPPAGETSYFRAPVAASWPEPVGFELPEPGASEVWIAAMMRLWRDAGVDMDEEFARELAALARRLKSDETFDDEPPPFVYTL